MANRWPKTAFLLVEDDDNDAELFDHAFIPLQRQVLIRRVKDGREAISYMSGTGMHADREQYPLPKVIILDLKMPGIDGFQFMRWLRLSSPEQQRLTPVVILAASNEDSDIKLAYALGANACMRKPMKLDIFRKQIELLGIYWAEYVAAPATAS